MPNPLEKKECTCWLSPKRLPVGNRFKPLVTDRVRSTTGRLCFDTYLSVCPQGGGYPSQVQTGGYPSQVQIRGIPRPGPDGGWGRGTPPGWGGTWDEVPHHPWQGWGTPVQVRMGVPKVGYPWQAWGTPPQPSQDGGYPRWGTPQQGWGTPQPDHNGGMPLAGMGYPLYRTADGVLDTPRSVCLLRSRRRTVLLTKWY